jgi:arginyl-tRNA synthetase
MRPQEYIRKNIKEAMISCGYPADDSRLLNLEKPKQEEFGDVSSPVAMSLSKIAREAPRRIAERLLEKLDRNSAYIEKIEIAGPGFINFYLAKPCLQQAVLNILKEGEVYGKSDWGKGTKIQFEFVSANPTGPLNIVSARAAAVGDVFSALHEVMGFEVEREYYVNDAGRQIRLLGASLSARYMAELSREEAFPEEGYHGEYLRVLAREIVAQDGDKYSGLELQARQALFSQMALERMLEKHKASLDKYRLHYQQWFRESVIREQNEHLKTLNFFEKKGYSYQQDGAIWFKATQFGDEKDRVLVTGEGEPTYFLIDIAYHRNKYARGFNIVHDLWGPDHHGYIERMRAAMVALDHPADSFQVTIIQQVNLLRGGQAVKMSKRAGEIIEMDELIEEVGVDAARYFFVDRKTTQPLDFDIDLAKKQSDENPVYYVQYAHARTCNIFRFAQERGVAIPEEADTTPLENTLELMVIKKLIDYPEVLSKAAQFLEPHRLTNYLHELAADFHRFYHEHRVITEDRQLTEARLMLTKATRQVLANGFKILGISVPEYM